MLVFCLSARQVRVGLRVAPFGNVQIGENYASRLHKIVILLDRLVVGVELIVVYFGSTSASPFWRREQFRRVGIRCVYGFFGIGLQVSTGI